MKIPDEDWVEKQVMERLALVGMGEPFTWRLWPFDDPETCPPDKLSWCVDIYELPTEFVGGKDDGAEVYSGFTTELTTLIAAMKPEEDSEHVEVGLHCDVSGTDTPFVCIGGILDGVRVYVQVHTAPSPELKAGRQMYEDHSFSYIDPDAADEDSDDDEEEDPEIPNETV